VPCSLPRWIDGWYFSVICAAPRAGFSQHHSGLPGPNYRSASTLNFSRFAQASLTLRPVDLLTHHCGLGRKASTPPVPGRRRFSATQAYRYPPEVGLSPTGVPRCKSAHWVCSAKSLYRQYVGVLFLVAPGFERFVRETCVFSSFVSVPAFCPGEIAGY
jgi:hypothetical protein